ncbi:MAG: hypothetical protein ACI9KF_000394, partial [Arenicella sp.]
ALLFTACSDAEGLAGSDDTALIAKIESASKTTVSADNLPSTTGATFNTDLLDTAIESVQLATGLGFKVSVVTDNIARQEKKSDVFFSTEGRPLKDNREKSKKRRHKCFEFVFPIDFIMPDDSSITLNEKADWTLIREWYQLNSDATERAAIVFPLEVIFKDGTVQMLLDKDELKSVKDSCKKGKDKRKCFRLVLPVSFTMPDATLITVNEKAAFKLIRDWHKENPDATEKGMLNYPVAIIYRDATTVDINYAADMKAAKDACK